MARIPLLHEDDPATPEDARTLLTASKAGRGRLVNLYRALANRLRTAALQAFGALGATTYRGPNLSRKEAELAYTTATVVNSCYY
jgi:alkylhydroperoxidase family enzyme